MAFKEFFEFAINLFILPFFCKTVVIHVRRRIYFHPFRRDPIDVSSTSAYLGPGRPSCLLPLEL